MGIHSLVPACLAREDGMEDLLSTPAHQLGKY